jgi:hypothetical protein
MKKFRLDADFVFEAESIDHAIILLTDHFNKLSLGDDSTLIEIGHCEIAPTPSTAPQVPDPAMGGSVNDAPATLDGAVQEYVGTNLLDFVVYVNCADWEAMKCGDLLAKQRIAEELDGVQIYFHAGPNLGPKYAAVHLMDVISHGVIPMVTLHKAE